MNYPSEYKAVHDFENGILCRHCGSKARHASGLCWTCYDKQPYSYHQTSREIFYNELVKHGLEWDKSIESAEDYRERCRKHFTERFAGTGLGRLVGVGKTISNPDE